MEERLDFGDVQEFINKVAALPSTDGLMWDINHEPYEEYVQEVETDD